MEFEEPEEVLKPQASRPDKLSEDNLSKLGSKKAPSKASDAKSKKSKKSQKPAWAITPKQEED